MAVTAKEPTDFEPDNGGVVLDMDPAGYVARLRPTARPLRFDIEGCAPHQVMPYFEIDDEAFTCYPLFPVRR